MIFYFFDWFHLATCTELSNVPPKKKNPDTTRALQLVRYPYTISGLKLWHFYFILLSRENQKANILYSYILIFSPSPFNNITCIFKYIKMELVNLIKLWYTRRVHLSWWCRGNINFMYWLIDCCFATDAGELGQWTVKNGLTFIQQKRGVLCTHFLYIY